MSNLFGNLTTSGLEESEDRLGGGFKPLNTDIYNVKVKVLYAGQADSGAKNCTVVAILPDGKEYRETIYITNKKGENFFLNKDDQTKKVPLPGFTTIDDICLAATGFPLAEQPFEEKVLKIYDFEQKKEVPTKVMVAVEVCDKEVSLAIQHVLEDKTKKNDQTGEYEATGETRELNQIAKVFHTESRVTMAEARSGQDAAFWDSWLERNKDKPYDKRKGAAPGAGKPAGKPPTAGGAGAPAGGRKSLFGK